MKNKINRFKFLVILISMCVILSLKSGNVYAYTLKNEELYCKSDIAMDLDSGVILFGKNNNEKIYPASTTKILTAILTIENLELDKKVIVSKNAYYSTPYGSSVMGVKADEIFNVCKLSN